MHYGKCIIKSALTEIGICFPWYFLLCIMKKHVKKATATHIFDPSFLNGKKVKKRFKSNDNESQPKNNNNQRVDFNELKQSLLHLRLTKCMLRDYSVKIFPK